MNKTISELLKETQEETMSDTKAQEVSGYTTDRVIECLKKSLNIHWQQTTVLSAQAVKMV